MGARGVGAVVAALQSSAAVVENAQGQPVRWNHSRDTYTETLARPGSQPPQTIAATSDPLDPDTDDDGLLDATEYERTHTDPRSQVTYEITKEQEDLLADVQSYGGQQWKISLESLGVSPSALDGGLTDANSDFDFVLDDEIRQTGSRQDELFKRLTFRALDGQRRSDTWLSNREELAYESQRTGRHLDVWDPDTDDDGLTDGQELKGLTSAEKSLGGPALDPSVEYQLIRPPFLGDRTDPTTPDTDGDGYWDGWIGVHGVNHSENVILYREHLQDGNGIEGDERVDEQVEIHEVARNDPGARLSSGGPKYHSAVHLGELHWERFDPSQRGDPTDGSVIPDPNLAVEVDWIEGHNPADRTIGGQPILDAVADNYALYGLSIDFDRDQSLSTAQVTDACVAWGETWAYKTCVQRVTLPGLNARELDRIENTYHDDTSKHYMLFATTYTNEMFSLVTHDPFIDPGVDGLQGHTGSPGQRSLIGNAPYGTVIFADEPELTSNETLTSTTMHEVGHALSIGWLDDKGEGHIAECYSGQDCVGAYGVGGGKDATPEAVDLQPNQPGGITDVWSVMARTGDPERLDHDRFAFSIEELLSGDFREIPTIHD